VGLLGGTFDPPHVGHLLLAECARDQLHLDKVLFLPVGHPPHKQQDRVTAAAHRLAMTRLAIAGHDAFQVDTTDLERPPPHYTVTLLPLIAGRHPGAAIWLLLGGDSLRDLPGWYRPEELPRMCRLAVLPRPGAAVDMSNLKRQVPWLETAVDILDGPAVAIAGRHMRRWAALGRSLRYMTPTSVISYIQQEKLYQPSDFSEKPDG
jgi:nicotinate-nucleotide adenylyltransferase